MNQQAMPSGPSLRTSPVLGWNTSTPLTVTWVQWSVVSVSGKSAAFRLWDRSERLSPLSIRPTSEAWAHYGFDL